MTQEEAINTVLNLARSEIGYHEKASNSQLNDKTANSGSGNWTKYAEYLDSYAGFYNGPKNGFAWCDLFNDYLFVKCFGVNIGREMLCQPMNSAGAGCLYSVQYYKGAGRWVTSPQHGDQIFFSYNAGEVSHTGIVESVTSTNVVTIEGNTSDRVARHTYSLSNRQIYGYGRPRWELALSLPAPAQPSTSQKEESVTSGFVSVVLKRGSVGEDVRDMQDKLIKLGYSVGRYGADGEFGNDTYKAVKQFQNDHGLKVDGEAGMATIEAINEALYGKPVTTQASSTSTRPSFSIGDIVMFNGNKCYSTLAGKTATSCTPGKALVIALSATAKHPYRLCKINGYGSTVFGWVDSNDVKKVS